MLEPPAVALSVLDTAPVWHGSSPAQALRETLELAKRVEKLGYLRYWVAEHHNAPFIASCAPPVLVAQIAAVTTSMRVGSGGVMLPNHPPLVVAEQFGTLEALHPNRVDLGLGRSPGTDLATARALRRVSSPPGSAAFAEQVVELLDYFQPAERRAAAAERITAVPAAGNRPRVWLLGASEENAELAGGLGLPFAYAYHVRPEHAVPVLTAYRSAFRPSATQARPYAIIAAPVIAADSDERAAWLAGPAGLVMLQASQGNRIGPNMRPEQAATHACSPVERAFIRDRLASHLIGGPDTVRRRLAALLASTGADELMAVTLVHELADRVRSYELLASVAAPVPVG